MGTTLGQLSCLRDAAQTYATAHAGQQGVQPSIWDGAAGQPPRSAAQSFNMSRVGVLESAEAPFLSLCRHPTPKLRL